MKRISGMIIRAIESTLAEVRIAKEDKQIRIAKAGWILFSLYCRFN
jgi:hypothetical protein